MRFSVPGSLFGSCSGSGSVRFRVLCSVSSVRCSCVRAAARCAAGAYDEDAVYSPAQAKRGEAVYAGSASRVTAPSSKATSGRR